MTLHVEDPRVNEYFCRSNPYGSRPQISYKEFQNRNPVTPLEKVIYREPSTKRAEAIRYCKVCFRLAKEF